MSKAEIEKIVKAFYEARWSNDLEKVGDYLLLDSRFIINASREPHEPALRASGKPEIDHLLAEWSKVWEWMEVDFLDLDIDDDCASVRYRLKAHFKPTNEIVETTIGELLFLRSGKIKEIIQLVDTDMAARLTGLRHGSQQT